MEAVSTCPLPSDEAEVALLEDKLKYRQKAIADAGMLS